MMPQNDDSTNELIVRIQHVTPRPLFILFYTLGRDNVLIPVLRNFFMERDGAKYGDNFDDLLLKAVEEIISGTHLSANEANIFGKEMAAKMLNTVKEKTLSLKSMEMNW